MCSMFINILITISNKLLLFQNCGRFLNNSNLIKLHSLYLYNQLEYKGTFYSTFRKLTYIMFIYLFFSETYRHNIMEKSRALYEKNKKIL